MIVAMSVPTLRAKMGGEGARLKKGLARPLDSSRSANSGFVPRAEAEG